MTTDFDLDTLQPVHNPGENRFEIPLGELFAVIEYAIRDTTITMYHTGVPRAYEGRGIAAKLTQFALDWSAENGYTVNPQCSYIRLFIERHPAYQANAV